MSLARGNATDLPFDEGIIDAIFMAFTLELFDPPRMESLLAECQRVLRPRGRMCVVALDRPLPSPPAVRAYDWLHRRFPDWVDCRPIYLEEQLRASGFRVESMHRRPLFGLPVGIALAAKRDDGRAVPPDRAT